MPRPVDKTAQSQRKTQLLNAVASVIAQDGLTALTMQRVIAASGLSAGSVYHLFKGKDDILAALVAQQDAGTQELIDALEAGHTVRDVLKYSANEMLDYLCDPVTARLNIELAIGARGDAPWAKALRAQDDRLRDALVVALRRDRDKGRLPRRMDPETAARMILALWDGLVSQAATAPFPNRAALKRPYIAALFGVLTP